MEKIVDDDALTAPEALTSGHDCSSFCSGEPMLDAWLAQRALKNQASGASRTYVVCCGRVVGYYSLAVGSASRRSATGAVARNMPDPVPVMLLARLAVDSAWQGRGLGASLLQDAVARTVQAADIAGIRAMLVHALSPDAERFYRYFGFQANSMLFNHRSRASSPIQVIGCRDSATTLTPTISTAATCGRATAPTHTRTRDANKFAPTQCHILPQ
jgi:GNAT superfamily N-acetyltransferase